jgi:hypothetical protein
MPTDPKVLAYQRERYARIKDELLPKIRTRRRALYQKNQESERARSLAKYYYFKKNDYEMAYYILGSQGLNPPASWIPPAGWVPPVLPVSEETSA